MISIVVIVLAPSPFVIVPSRTEATFSSVLLTLATRHAHRLFTGIKF